MLFDQDFQVGSSKLPIEGHTVEKEKLYAKRRKASMQLLFKL
jgi:hypothetical protein